jgi:hypothetical protein
MQSFDIPISSQGQDPILPPSLPPFFVLLFLRKRQDELACKLEKLITVILPLILRHATKYLFRG